MSTTQLLITSAIVTLGLVSLYAWLQAERRLILLIAGGFVLAVTGFFLGAAVETAHSLAAGDAVRAGGILVLGLSVISLAGVLVFGAVLPALWLHAPRILRDVIVGAGHLIWVLVWLRALGVNLTGLIATSAVVTAVIGFSMQDTLGNLISGLALQLDDSLHVGQWVRVDDVRGRVIETGWRSTKLQTTNWEIVVIPNSVLVKSRFTVLGLEEGDQIKWRRWIYFNVDYRYSPAVVIDAVEKGVRAARIAAVASQPPPNCIQTDFAESYARYAVRYWLTEPTADDPTDSEVRSHIYFALRRVGIAPSIPAAAVFMTEETTERAATKADQERHKRMEALQKIDLFKDLPTMDLERLAASMVPSPFGKGEIMTRQGAEAHWMYLIVSGTADVLVENETGDSAHVAQLGAGSFFGEWACMTGLPRDATVVAASKVDCYRLDKEMFRETIQGRPDLAEQLSAVIARRKTERDAILEHLDAEAKSVRLNKTENFVLESLQRFFGLTE